MAGQQKSLHPLVAVGVAALLAGCLAWAWLGEWRWAVTGLVVFVGARIAVELRGKEQP